KPLTEAVLRTAASGAVTTPSLACVGASIFSRIGAARTGVAAARPRTSARARKGWLIAFLLAGAAPPATPGSRQDRTAAEARPPGRRPPWRPSGERPAGRVRHRV